MEGEINYIKTLMTGGPQNNTQGVQQQHDANLGK